MTEVKKVLLLYGANGPGGSDDQPKVLKAKFSSPLAFNPTQTDNDLWTVMDQAMDQVAIRGTYSEAFRAPGPAETLRVP
jgi:hypothetical protein